MKLIIKRMSCKPSPEYCESKNRFSMNGFLAILLSGFLLLPFLIANASADATCGNGIVESGEQCDDGNLYDYDMCMNDCKWRMAEINVSTCTGQGELYLYRGDPFQPINTSFFVNRNQLLIFARNSATISARVDQNDITPEIVFQDTHVTVYSLNTTNGSLVSVNGTSPYGARGIQGYLAQDRERPVYNSTGITIIYDNESENYMYLRKGEYSYIIFDKYTINLPGEPEDYREVTAKVKDESNNSYIVTSVYDHPYPSGTQGAVVDNFQIEDDGPYTFSVDTEDSIYWPLAQCKVTCEDADYSYDVNMWVTGINCYYPDHSTDYDTISVPVKANYSVKGWVSRGHPGHCQTNEDFYLEINGESGPETEDDPDPCAVTERLDFLGNFSFVSGNNDIIMHTASRCPPDTTANSVDLNRICLYRIYDISADNLPPNISEEARDDKGNALTGNYIPEDVAAINITSKAFDTATGVISHRIVYWTVQNNEYNNGSVECGPVYPEDVSECYKEFGYEYDTIIKYYAEAVDRAGNRNVTEARIISTYPHPLANFETRNIYIEMGDSLLIPVKVRNIDTVTDNITVWINSSFAYGKPGFVSKGTGDYEITGPDNEILNVYNLNPMEERTFIIYAPPTDIGEYYINMTAISKYAAPSLIDLDRASVTIKYPVTFPGLSFWTVILIIFLSLFLVSRLSWFAV